MGKQIESMTLALARGIVYIHKETFATAPTPRLTSKGAPSHIEGKWELS